MKNFWSYSTAHEFAKAKTSMFLAMLSTVLIPSHIKAFVTGTFYHISFEAQRVPFPGRNWPLHGLPQ